MASAAFRSRLVRLEARAGHTSRLNSGVVTVDTEGRVISGPSPGHRGRVMVVVDHGTDAEWEAALRAQQARLVRDCNQPVT